MSNFIYLAYISRLIIDIIDSLFKFWKMMNAYKFQKLIDNWYNWVLFKCFNIADEFFENW